VTPTETHGANGLVGRVATVVERMIDVRPMIDASPSHIRRLHAEQIARAVVAVINEGAI
jgi:hypothetical protein